MTIGWYKGYKILTVGISRYIYRPDSDNCFGDGLAQSMTEAKRWINQDVQKQLHYQSLCCQFGVVPK